MRRTTIVRASMDNPPEEVPYKHPTDPLERIAALEGGFAGMHARITMLAASLDATHSALLKVIVQVGDHCRDNKWKEQAELDKQGSHQWWYPKDDWHSECTVCGLKRTGFAVMKGICEPPTL